MTVPRPGPATLGVVLVLLGLVAWAVPARAQLDDDNNPAIEKITALNKKAVDAYNDLEFEEARKILKQALDLCTSAGLDGHPVAARTHIHMGVVLIAAKQQDLGIKQFKKAIEIQPDIQVTKQLANPEILDAFKEAGAGMPAQPAAEDASAASAAPPPPAPPRQVKGIQHRPVTRGRKGKPVPIVVTIGDDVTGYTKVHLEFRPEGAAEFDEIEMQKTGTTYTGEIPARATQGSLASYYIEADSDNEEADAIATSGSEDHPYNVFLTAESDGSGGAAPPECQGDGCEEEEALPPYFVAFTGGIGFGLTSGYGEINSGRKVGVGFQPASVAQLAPEVGYFVTPTFRLSVQLRYQIVSGTTPLNLDQALTPEQKAAHPEDLAQCGDDHLCSTRTSSAVAVLARGAWFFGAGGAFRPYFSLALGGGYMRHQVTFSSLMKCGVSGTETCVDTVLAGPVFAGPGAGLLYALTPKIGLLFDVTSVLGFPKFTYNFDVNAGAALRF